MQKILSSLRKAIIDYKMIKDGDHIVVGLSGGKDSILLLTALANYQIFSPEKFKLSAVTIDLGFQGVVSAEVQAVKDHCTNIGVDYKIIKTDIAQIVFDERKESNPCSLCAKMRRGALNSTINEMGANKLALGHNADDALETMIMSMVFEGRFSTFAPTAFMDRTKVTLIRPLIYIEEYEVKSTCTRLNLPIIHNPCPANHFTKREWAKDMVKTICEQVPTAKVQMLGAIFHPERNNLWQKPED
ncbi:MAG: tRNA 2-thiocytidine biosynthesis TtcA family protein [Clostridia bacterium]|nr:tRNA 2-thiocytidine biosynthesis TtcA family protein [Clostridia bacterium]